MLAADEEFPDLASLRIAPSSTTDPEMGPLTLVRTAKTRRTEILKFVQVPLLWKERLVGARGSTYDLALELLAESFLSKKAVLTVSNILADRVSLSRAAKQRALLQLEELGLIRAEREGNRSARVTLLGMPLT